MQNNGADFESNELNLRHLGRLLIGYACYSFLRSDILSSFQSIGNLSMPATHMINPRAPPIIVAPTGPMAVAKVPALNSPS